MHGFDFIQDLAVVLLVAGAAGWVCQRIGLSVVVGFLAAGIVVGPYTPPFALVTDTGRIETLAQIGLVFLMFAIGLRLSVRKLRGMGFAILAAVFIATPIIYWLTKLLGVSLGMNGRECLFLSAMLMVSSSAIVTKVLYETGATHDRVGQLAIGYSVLEDIVAVVMLTLLNSMVQFGSAGHTPLGQTLGTFGAFVVLAGVAGLLLVPWILKKMSISAGEELQTLGLCAMLFGLAMVAQRAGYSLALGAFLLGTIVAETPHRTQVERSFEGMRDVFTAVFFVAIGMQIDLSVLADSIWLILGIAVFTVIVRATAATLGLSLMGHSVKEALRVGLSVTPIGEFSFIIAQLGVGARVIPPKFYPIAVGVSLLTTLTAPMLTRNSETISKWLLGTRPRWLRAWHSYYYEWLEYLKARQKRNLLWQLSRKRFLQVGVEMLLVTGLLVFSEPLLDLCTGWLGRDWIVPNGLAETFWVVLALIVLVPMVAIWRNISALCLLFAQVTTSGHPQAARLRPIVEGMLKILAGAGLYIWLSALLPMGEGTRWVIWSSIVVALGALLLLKRKLVYWHSEIEVGLHGVLHGEISAKADPAAPWLRPDGDWNLSVIECVIPDLADCQGRSLASLDLRARFGCTVAGIGRQGYMISLPTPDTILYPRDKVLLIGTAAQVAAGKAVIQAVSEATPAMVDFEDVCMEAMVVPRGSPAAGKDLKTISPAQNYRIQIVGIKREGEERTLNPAGDEVIREDDEILALGTPMQIRSFREWLTPEG